MSTAVKTNETPGVRARLTHARFSASKARAVLDLIRGKSVDEALNELDLCERGAADPVRNVLDSAIANAGNNNDIPPEELFVGACYADEGPTLKRWRPRARGRATQILKRTCHITVIVSRYTAEEMDELRKRAESRGRVTSDARADRARRVARSRADSAEGDDDSDDEAVDAEIVTDESVDSEVSGAASDITATEEAPAEEAATDEAVSDDAAEEPQDAEEPQVAVKEEPAADDADGDSDSETEEKN